MNMADDDAVEILGAASAPSVVPRRRGRQSRRRVVVVVADEEARAWLAGAGISAGCAENDYMHGRRA